MDGFKKKKEKLCQEIFASYNYDEWSRISHKNISHIPEDMQKIYYRFHYLKLKENFLLTDKEQRQQLAELKKIRMIFKHYFKHVKRQQSKHLNKGGNCYGTSKFVGIIQNYIFGR